MRRAALLLVMAAALASPGSAQLRQPPLPLPPPPVDPPARRTPVTTTTTTFTPKFEAVAETRLLMEGMTHANYKSLQKLLKTKPADRDTWVFARGQAILVAESGNLLLLRPPRSTARDTWMKLAMDMRAQATTLARAAAAKDHARSVQGLADLTASCQRCHQTFRVAVKLGEEPPAAIAPGEVETNYVDPLDGAGGRP